ncbi:Methyltransferase protein 22 [Spatholobus suberectus]|nr:Methyltransferase protein 22 [Spatholobus suberectus]
MMTVHSVWLRDQRHQDADLPVGLALQLGSTSDQITQELDLLLEHFVHNPPMSKEVNYPAKQGFQLCSRLSDHGTEILDNCAKNVQLNFGLLNYQAKIYVRELDWFNQWPPKAKVEEAPCTQKYSWTLGEIEDAENASILVAADVIYSDELTDAFFSTLERLMSRGSTKVLYMALEKRYNFSLSDLDVVANGYSHFQSYLRDEDEIESLEPVRMPNFVGKRIDISQIPQYVGECDRGRDVEIWHIKYFRSKYEASVTLGSCFTVDLPPLMTADIVTRSGFAVMPVLFPSFWFRRC